MADQEKWRGFRAVLATALRRSGLRQYELAERVGVDPSTVHGWLHEQALPHGQNLTQLAKVLGLTPEDLVPSSGRAAPTKGEETNAYLTGGRVVLDELEVLLSELRKRWEGQSARAGAALEHYEALEQTREKKGKRQNRG